VTEDFPKPRYEPPVMIDLGSIAKGSGQAPIDCTAGASATNNCTAGGNATSACTAGTSAIQSCTNGVAATVVTCSGGSLKV
jgi:hypothetical protein